MKAILMSTDGIAYAESVPSHKRQVQLRDGYHIITPVAIYRDIDHQRPSISIYWQGRIHPEGAPNEDLPAHEAAEDFFHEQSIIRDHKMKPGVSKAWLRSLTTALIFFGKTAAMVFGSIMFSIMLYIFMVIL